MTPIVQLSKLDQFKRLLGAGAEDEFEAAPSDAESENMAIKLEKDELEAMMTRVVASAVSVAKPAESGGDVNAVAAAQPLKIANFWSEDVEAWFLRLETQFHTRRITADETKFSHVIQSLDRAQTMEIKHILKNPPKGTSYEAVKAALIEAFEITQLEKDTKLLGMFSLDDRDPRSVVRELRALNEDPETLLRAILINMLPQDIRVALSNMDGKPTLEQLGERAWKALDLRKERKVVHAIQRQPAGQDQEDEDEINAVQSRGGNGRGRGRFQGQPQGQKTGHREEANFVCFAHKKFGPKAYSCKPGCSFAELPLAQRGAGNGPAGR